jgi:transposase
VFVDECGTHTSMTRRYGRAPKDQRAYSSVPRNRGKNTTLMASLSLEGIGAAMAVEGSTTQKVFEAYVERVLAPTLRPGQVVILDNLGAHKGEKVKQLIQSRAAGVVFLPAYSPDFNPIEEAFSKIKAILKKMAARAREALIEAIGSALEAVRSQDVWGWFAHCGYVDGDQPS